MCNLQWVYGNWNEKVSYMPLCGASECDDIRLNEMNDEHTKSVSFSLSVYYMQRAIERAYGRCQVLSFS